MEVTHIENDASNAGPRNSATQNSPVSAFNRIFSRQTLNVILLMFLALGLSGMLRQPQRLLNDPDIWWHLADARLLVTTHHFIQVEPFSFTVAGERWINPEWISELPFWFSYHLLGLSGICLVSELALCGNIFMIYWRSYRKSHHAAAAFWSAALAVVLMTMNAGPRTILIAYFAMSAELTIIETAERGKTNLLWLLPPLFCIWINLHGSWVIGLGLLILYLFCGVFPYNIGIFEQSAFSRKDRAQLLWVVFTSAVALLLNPYGWRLIWNPFDMLLNQKMMIQSVEEWQHLRLISPVGITTLATIALMIVANIIRARKWKVYEIAFLVFAWYEAFAHQRFAFMAAVVMIPTLAGEVARGFFGPSNEKTIPVLNALFAASVVCATILFFPTETFLQKQLANRYPLQTVATIQPSWRIFNEETVGGMMDLHTKSTFLDTRYDTFLHHGVMQDYFRIESIDHPQNLFSKYQIDHVLVHVNSKLYVWLEQSPAWRLERSEGFYALFAKAADPHGLPSLNSTRNR